MKVLRYAAFTTDPQAGNPAGVVLDAAGAADSEMLAVAAEVGYSETAFLCRRPDGDLDARYFAPTAEVPFCGHATIASAVVLAERDGPGELVLHTRAGDVTVRSSRRRDGRLEASLTTVEPRSVALPDADLEELLATFGWDAGVLDRQLPARVAYAGAWHPIVGLDSRQRLAAMAYDFDALAALMARRDWTTIDLVWRESPTTFHARNPFPPGGVVEDPATGAAAGAFGGYLRELGLLAPPATLTIHQGEDLGRPSLLTVQVPVAGAVTVSGTAVPISASR